MNSTITVKEKQTILIVDDSPENITVLNAALKGTYSVKAATGARQALNVAAEAHIDLILLDVMMPEMDGYEVCRRLKNGPAPVSEIPVIFVTTMDEIADQAMGFAVGGEDYIIKPIIPELVLARVKVHLELRNALRDLSQQNAILRENMQLREQVGAMTRHDLKSPLTAVMNFPLLLMGEDNITERQRGFLKQIYSAGSRMLEIVNRTIDLYKMENGTYTPKRTDVDILSVIDQLRSEMTPYSQQKFLTWKVHVNGLRRSGEYSFTMPGEEYLYYCSLQNLLKNACEAAPQESCISIMLQSGEPAEIAVHNQGAIPKDIRDTFFQKFTTSGKEAGTGLGTYSAQLMVKTMGGEISFESSEESGTTLYIRI